MTQNADAELKKEIVAICKLMDSKGLVAGTEGNVSARAADGTVLMTPSGFNKGDITEDMLVRLDLDANVIEGDYGPTSEKYMHLEFYRQRPKAMGVAHGHPIYSTAFAAAGRDLPHGILPELVAVIGQIVTVPYGRPSSAKLAASIAPYVLRHNVFLLQNHGATAVGTSVRDAFHRLQVAEAYAKTVWVAEAIGGVQPLTMAQIADLPLPSYE
ncbi:class II aldolase/adducin family protein [Lentilitoribacter sp. Alg239-R112]|uniref:class II aldolase/adducin family protein n=1 Tax=Lentilitoribacter sp. Alg239-R112 TaxID=2305987 RepID=UPI0013A6F3BB|nr:class II aldolase/adducin family protein [Lentilitoribacter sp. Alg239-R112]